MNKKLYDLKIKLAEIIYLKYINKYKYLKGENTLSEFEKYKGKKKVVLTVTPTHGNLGDHAIAYASKKFIENHFSDYEFLELDMNEIYEKGKALKNILGKEDIIMTLGGGNMGDLYNNEEWTRRFIIETFKDTKIISLPQTICFSKTKRGKKELQKTKKIYGKHNNLKLVAREQTSLEIMKKEFGEDRVSFYPDMVLSLNKEITSDREGILLCLRSDKEGIFDEKFKDSLLGTLKKKYKKVTLSDTVIQKSVNKNTRNEELDKMWKDISKSEVVITDRLHGMIFCAITNTPCIVLKTYNHKVVQAFNWLKSSGNIVMMDDEKLDSFIKKIEAIKGKENKLNFDLEYQKLADYIKGIII